MSRYTWEQMKTWYVGRTYVRRRKGKQSTLRVIDVTLGGDLVVKGRGSYDRRIPQAEWFDWVKDAVRIA